MDNNNKSYPRVMCLRESEVCACFNYLIMTVPYSSTYILYIYKDVDCMHSDLMSI